MRIKAILYNPSSIFANAMLRSRSWSGTSGLPCTMLGTSGLSTNRKKGYVSLQPRDLPSTSPNRIGHKKVTADSCLILRYWVPSVLSDLFRYCGAFWIIKKEHDRVSAETEQSKRRCLKSKEPIGGFGKRLEDTHLTRLVVDSLKAAHVTQQYRNAKSQTLPPPHAQGSLRSVYLKTNSLSLEIARL